MIFLPSGLASADKIGWHRDLNSDANLSLDIPIGNSGLEDEKGISLI
jgi:hypothetical protein